MPVISLLAPPQRSCLLLWFTFYATFQPSLKPRKVLSATMFGCWQGSLTCMNYDSCRTLGDRSKRVKLGYKVDSQMDTSTFAATTHRHLSSCFLCALACVGTCKAVKNHTVTIPGPNGAVCVNVTDECECQRGCFRSSYNMVFNEQVTDANTGEKTERAKVSCCYRKLQIGCNIILPSICKYRLAHASVRLMPPCIGNALRSVL